MKYKLLFGLLLFLTFKSHTQSFVKKDSLNISNRQSVDTAKLSIFDSALLFSIMGHGGCNIESNGYDIAKYKQHFSKDSTHPQ